MKRLLKFILSGLVIASLAACGGGGDKKEMSEPKYTAESQPEEKQEADPKGIGEVENVKLTDPLVDSLVEEGKAIYEMKCASCHKLTDERVVGPGWAGITNKRTPEWIMNMITNVDVMLAEDPTAQKLLEQCMTRMPNQNVSIEQARAILEFMRKNDMEKVGKKDQAAI